jgi:hypothetical protein
MTDLGVILDSKLSFREHICHVYSCFLLLTLSLSQVKKIESWVNVNFSTPWVQYEPVKIFGSKLNSIPVENSSFSIGWSRELAIVNVTIDSVVNKGSAMLGFRKRLSQEFRGPYTYTESFVCNLCPLQTRVRL